MLPRRSVVVRRRQLRQVFCWLLLAGVAGLDVRLAGCAPIPVSSGRPDRHRLDPGGNRQLNQAFYMLAICKICHDPRTPIYLAKQRANGKTKKEAIRSLKRHLVRRVYHLLHDPASVPITVCLT